MVQPSHCRHRRPRLRLDKFGFICLTNRVDLGRTTEESKNSFALIHANYGAIKGVVTQVASKTIEHDLLLQKVDSAFRTQV